MRHLDHPADTAPEDLPLAAVVDILERGDLDDWLPIARAVAADPEGAFAAAVERLVNAFPMYGTSPLWRAWVDRRRARGDTGSGQVRTLPELRRQAGLTQQQVADRIGMRQSDLSKLERRGDVRLSSLHAYVAALGGRLRLLVEFSDGVREIRTGPPDPVDGP